MYILPCNFFLNSAFLSTLFLNGFRAHRWSFCRNFSVIIWWIDFIHSLPWKQPSLKMILLISKVNHPTSVWNHKACLPFQHQTRKTTIRQEKQLINLKCYWSLKTRFSGTNIRVLYYFWGFYSLNILKAKTQRKVLLSIYWTTKLWGKNVFYTEVFLSVKRPILLFLII